MASKIRDKQRQNIENIIQSEFRHGTNGKWVADLEAVCKKTYSKKYAIAQCNGTATLHTALLAAGVGKGDYVITTPLTMSSPSIAIRLCGATPIYVDVDEKTWLIDFAKIKRSMLEKSKAIIGVSLYGLPCDFKWFNKHLRPANPDIVTINDSAQQLNPYECGADIVSLSFQASKQITCGEGGMILTNRGDLADKIRGLCNLGYPITTNIIKKSDLLQFHTVRHTMLGYNYRMSDLQAAFLLPQVEELPMYISRRRDVAQEYDEILEKFPGLRRQAHGMTQLLDNHSYWAYAVDAGPMAQRILSLNKEWYGGYTSIYPVWELSYKEPVLAMTADCPIAERLSNSIIQFPTNNCCIDEFKDALESAYAKEAEVSTTSLPKVF